ncbi:hypothetical protein G7Z12_37640 [Streptomyces sp. ID38640]|uniref:hypothetical protein n=1 Tax=Streptomyces sp. ID38640 TaxID=1265399 RepID=UPI00140ED9BF|nr:hypothetical protein [Streptomyces sp. ID38640]QIK04722.1 hypothetical protein G7Z12_00100 [Streptomyces sp. ID38640]QIK10887.1 hypothetical protein G7Z12_37395 [Streptomyces sp. ID38640]QIK10924.1 hypothetical protein G7Z12_37640 [Streptomyces sp. ID38640]
MLLTHTPTPPTPALMLPPAFEAFYTLQHTPYLAYAHAHLPPDQATTVVQKAFGTLATHWSQLVSSSNPTADAWDHLSHQVRRHAAPLPLTTDCVLRYDVLVLAALGYTPTDSAGITGRHPSKIHYLTHTATTPTASAVHGES